MDTKIAGLEAQAETLDGEKKILEEKEKEKSRQNIAISTELAEQKKRTLERERKREGEEKFLGRAKEDAEHETAETEYASKIREVEEQLAELNAGDEV